MRLTADKSRKVFLVMASKLSLTVLNVFENVKFSCYIIVHRASLLLLFSFLQYISSEVNPPSDESDSSSAPSKEQLEQEKQLLLSFKPVMQKFLHDHVDLQVSALYALQVHCYNNNFPKGMLLRFFVHFYDMEIIEEEAFLAWKEDITQEFPGKGKALFQVNQWLTWLETAEEEESEEEAD